VSKSILIVDDNDAIRTLTRLLLETQIDLKVCGEAVDGVDAIKKTRKLKPDLVLLDLSMPRMNGIEAASVIKSTMPEVFIILFTLYRETLGNALASAVGIDAVVSKPDGWGKLIECIQSLLQDGPVHRAAANWKSGSPEKRGGRDRRQGGDRRAIATAWKSGSPERRGGRDRRQGGDRRAIPTAWKSGSPEKRSERDRRSKGA